MCRLIFTIFLILFFPIDSFSFSNGENNYIDKSNIPIFEKGYDINFFYKNDILISCNYYIIEKFPANNVIYFYDKSLLQLGFKENANSTWEYFYSDNGLNKHIMMYKIYANIEKKIDALLILEYNILNEKIEDNLNIKIQISKSVDISELDVFFEKLKNDGEFQNFMDIIDCYILKNGDIDIEQAIKDNPNNRLLKEYKDIIMKLK